jgi:hypothetical protein
MCQTALAAGVRFQNRRSNLFRFSAAEDSRDAVITK